MINNSNLCKKQKEQIMFSQGTAHHIETLLEKIFNKNVSLKSESKEFHLGGLIHADHIRRHPFLSMTQGLAVIYYLDESKRKQICDFVDKFIRYEKMSIDDIYWFDEKAKMINEKEIFELEKDNGIEELKYMIEEFEKII